ncbi:MAG: hypothetical protein A2Z75_06305 [Chloroflexi bacterium RBG_13_50_10]|nr:MAG: hypothetical protein A2Z75_06305 [Chloroflexi bacterium RBG_13_50_10]
MPRAKFRLDSVTIEGFKGFADRQTITFSGKHAFLFGKNGIGKSSVVEAIRWCLFGLAERPESEVRNAYYAPGECQVELALQGPGGIWHIRRRLRPGAERSRATITNPAGQEVLQAQVFPYLARMGPKEGTHVIFAAQQATGRRPQADVSDFHKVLYSYLHLEEVPDLLERLDKILEEQKSAREDVASEIEEIEEEIREKLRQAEFSLEELLRNPPWAEGEMPTYAETETRVRSFAQEIADLASKSLGADIPAREALEQAEQWCQGLATANRQELQGKLGQQRGKAANLRNLLQALERIEKNQAEATANVAISEKELASVCDGRTTEDLQKEIELFKTQMHRSASKLEIAKYAEQYCTNYSPAECPACLTRCGAKRLIEKVKLSIEQGTPEQIASAEKLESLKTTHAKVLELNSRLDELKTEIQRAEQGHDSTMTQIRALLGVSNDALLSKEYITTYLSSIDSSIHTLEKTLDSTESSCAQLRKRTETFRSELRFHTYRDKQQRIQRQLTSGLDPVRDQLRELVELENTVHNIRETLGQALNEAIDRALPHLNDMMTDVYQRLTGQESFEKICIQRTNGYGAQSLQVRVGSERIPDQLFDPEDVLNGQANSALRLVPYFVFSQFQAEALELDLLLIDDPSQSFDTSHIDFLLQELADAGSHAQLIIATHEDERFGPQINHYFATDEYEVIGFTKFDVKKGPSFVVDR